MFTLDDLTSQLAALFGGGNSQGNGVTTYGAPDPLSKPLNANGLQFGGANSGQAFNFGAGTPSGLGANLGTAQLGLQGLSALSSLIGSNKAYGLAKDQFNFTKDVTNTNLNNSIKSYNTSLTDRATSRAFVQGDSDAVRDSYIDRNRLTR